MTVSFGAIFSFVWTFLFWPAVAASAAVLAGAVGGFAATEPVAVLGAAAPAGEAASVSATRVEQASAIFIIEDMQEDLSGIKCEATSNSLPMLAANVEALGVDDQDATGGDPSPTADDDHVLFFHIEQLTDIHWQNVAVFVNKLDHC